MYFVEGVGEVGEDARGQHHLDWLARVIGPYPIVGDDCMAMPSERNEEALATWHSRL